MQLVAAAGAINRCAKLQSIDHHQQTNTQLFTGGMPFLSPNQQSQSTLVCDCTFDLCLQLLPSEAQHGYLLKLTELLNIDNSRNWRFREELARSDLLENT